RACSSFFKRTEVAGRKFTCRQGERKCEIKHLDKFTCRSCRYDRCVELGMTYVLPPKKKPRKATLLDVEPELPSTSSTAITQGPARESLLDRMEKEYKASCERRLILEKDYVARHNLQPFGHPTEEFYNGNFTSFYDILRISMKDSTSLLKNVFDDFDSLPIAHRVTLFKNFYSK
ncbi:hypothetical protein PENTCL1PPCAC_15628, partial [Pristionchus entomophagus]